MWVIYFCLGSRCDSKSPPDIRSGLLSCDLRIHGHFKTGRDLQKHWRGSLLILGSHLLPKQFWTRAIQKMRSSFYPPDEPRLKSDIWTQFDRILAQSHVLCGSLAPEQYPALFCTVLCGSAISPLVLRFQQRGDALYLGHGCPTGRTLCWSPVRFRRNATAVGFWVLTCQTGLQKRETLSRWIFRSCISKVLNINISKPFQPPSALAVRFPCQFSMDMACYLANKWRLTVVSLWPTCCRDSRDSFRHTNDELVNSYEKLAIKIYARICNRSAADEMYRSKNPLSYRSHVQIAFER